jgi:excinuclease ABC subunit B
MSQFNLVSDYKPAGDQPQAIDALVKGLEDHKKHQLLLGVTGSGKTFTMANVIATVDRPALILAHNKTLAAQLCSEFRQFFPDNAVEYFVSYYDYYQPEAYVPSRDVYIEKESQINEEIERLRHSATRSLLSRRDVIVVASVSCIYGLGTPENYIKGVIYLHAGQLYPRRDLLLTLDHAHYQRNDVELKRGRYRIKGDVIDIFPSWDDAVLRLEFFGDELDRILRVDPVSFAVIEARSQIDLYPATHYVVDEGMNDAIKTIEAELAMQLAVLEKEGKPLEAHRLMQRTKFDIEMIQEIGYCKGIENYSRHLEQRPAGTPPGVLMDFFPDDFITFVDESHASIPQIRGMFNGDQSRKRTLVDFGFRLPSALDNRPLRFEEFEERVGQTIYVSATPGLYELEKCQNLAIKRPDRWNGVEIVEQVIRPTGLIDPAVECRHTLGQVDDLLGEIHRCIQQGERVLVTALTKLMSEDLSAYFEEKGIKVCYLHSDIDALKRIDILHMLRKGDVDVLVGVNLLREGLDLPEVSLVAIMDADKEGFLRNERSLIQTMGRAARNINGKVILYADRMTESMRLAIDETNRRREKQMEHNRIHNIIPTTIIKKINDIRDEDRKRLEEITQQQLSSVAPDELPNVIEKLTKEMNHAAKNLEFEVAAVIRDQIERLKEMGLGV